jgi:hypothetical protein
MTTIRLADGAMLTVSRAVSTAMLRVIDSSGANALTAMSYSEIDRVIAALTHARDTLVVVRD